MKPQEAIDEINDFIRMFATQEYSLEALDNAVDALRMQIPKEPIEGAYMEEYEDYFDSGKTFRCTECDRDIGSYSEEMQEWIWRFPYCPDCGQKIKWGE